jgi:hypothetical protein
MEEALKWVDGALSYPTRGRPDLWRRRKSAGHAPHALGILTSHPYGEQCAQRMPDDEDWFSDLSFVE